MNNPVNVAPTDQELAEHESSLSQDDLVKVEGTKVGQEANSTKTGGEELLGMRLELEEECVEHILFWGGTGMGHTLLTIYMHLCAEVVLEWDTLY